MIAMQYRVLGLVFAAMCVALLVSAPRTRAPVDYAKRTADIQNGAMVFTAAGCASCHMKTGAQGDAQLLLTGGQRFSSDFGTFIAPNISTDRVHGIGGWTINDFSNAVRDGVSPEGSHYFPAMPYTAYNKMTDQDTVDLWAYMQSLAATAQPNEPHILRFPFNIRRAVGGWKVLFMRDTWVIGGPLDANQERGRYLAEAIAHCGECHTPRNALGGLKTTQWLWGAPNPSGEGKVPNITVTALTWTEAEIVEYLTSGFTPEFDSVGGHMAHVVDNMSKLPQSDREAIAGYLKIVPGSPQP